MNKNIYFTRSLVGLLVLLLAAPPWVFAQNAGADRTFRQEELDQMLAPVALYPDSLLAQILVAATYPTQVTEADRWVQQNKDLKGDALNNALDRMDWDLSVKALVPFPQVLAMMDDKLSWTENLGEAFLAQQTQVMDTVQKLRARAQAEGNLKSTKEQTVLVKGDSIEIAPTNPEVVYVPYYDPAVIYGTWWYPAYPPYAWYPFFPGGPLITYGLFGFAAGIAVASAWNWGWGHWDWGHHVCNVNVARNININRNHIGTVHTANWNHWSRETGHRSFSSSRSTGMRDTGRLGTWNRPSAASVQKGLHEGTVHSNRAGAGTGHGQANRNANLGKSTTKGGNHGSNLSHGGNNFSRGGNRFGNANTGAPHTGNFSKGGNRFGNADTGAPRAGSFSHGGMNMPHGGSLGHGGGFAGGGNHGGAGAAHGGGGGAGRHVR